MSGKQTPSTLVGVALGLITAVIWGAWPVLSRLSISGTLNAHDITALRFGVAGLLLLPYLWRKGMAGLPWHVPVLMVCGAGAPYILMSVLGLNFAPAGHFGVITPSSMLVFSAFAGWFLMGEKPGVRRLVGLGVIVMGVACIGWQGLAGGDRLAWVGDLIFLGGGFLWATYTVASKVYGVGSLHATALVSVFSMVLYLPIYLVFGLGNLAEAPLFEIAWQALFQGVIVAIIALVCYTRAIAILGVGRGSIFAALVPCFVLILAIPVLKEWPNGLEVLGLIMVTSGMLLALIQVRSNQKGRSNAAPKSQIPKPE